ncbi:FHA domain-containing protein [Actinomyces capricornis]|uniref:FHA domain-containing protein n=1 Tax=Actinomyces capricornis TaxID=2755559 RepID=A0ABM7UBC1_9ACTO|nr:FHA domain-containing protein [Actinomyces capricornis]BDA64579.1 hypothetical protein MANAM107_14130 [Actinomyces capricornis]
MTGTSQRGARIVGGAGSGPPTAAGADEAGAGLPQGVSLTREGALRIEGLDGVVLLLEPRAHGPVGSSAREPAAPQPGASQDAAQGEGSPAREGAVDPEARAPESLGPEVLDPEALELAARLLEALGGVGLLGTATSTAGEEAAEPTTGPEAADPEPADPEPAGPEPDEGSDGGAAGAPGSPATQEAQDLEGRECEEDEDPQVTGVWIDPDDLPEEGAADAEGAGATPYAALPGSPAREGEQPPAPVGAARAADAAESPGLAGPAASSGASSPDLALDLPVFDGFPEPEPGSGRRRRSPRSASSASAVVGALSAASGSLPLPGAPPERLARGAPAPSPPQTGGPGGEASGSGAVGVPMQAGPGAPAPAAPWGEGEAGRSTTVIPAALAALGAAPIVLASLCPRGHANPPDLGQCVRCGHALRGDFRQVPRPVLVTLSISSGEEVPVAGDIVVGRAPQPPVGADAHLVALVSVPSTTHLVSRSHLIFTTAEWNVFVQDLGSSNGTVLARPGHAAVLLPPYVPTPLLVGDLLDVGDGVTIHVEAPR